MKGTKPPAKSSQSRSAEPDRPTGDGGGMTMLGAMRSPNAARAALGFLAAAAILIGVTAAFAPRTFYDDFPFVTHWVELLPPYNEHLVTDVGGLYLGFAVLFAWAAWT